MKNFEQELKTLNFKFNVASQNDDYDSMRNISEEIKELHNSNEMKY